MICGMEGMRMTICDRTETVSTYVSTYVLVNRLAYLSLIYAAMAKGDADSAYIRTRSLVRFLRSAEAL